MSRSRHFVALFVMAFCLVVGVKQAWVVVQTLYFVTILKTLGFILNCFNPASKSAERGTKEHFDKRAFIQYLDLHQVSSSFAKRQWTGKVQLYLLFLELRLTSDPYILCVSPLAMIWWKWRNVCRYESASVRMNCALFLNAEKWVDEKCNSISTPFFACSQGIDRSIAQARNWLLAAVNIIGKLLFLRLK